MPSVVPYSPSETRRLLESEGYSVVLETDQNWFFMKDQDEAPFSIPWLVSTVPLKIANEVARRVGLSKYISWRPYEEER